MDEILDTVWHRNKSLNGTNQTANDHGFKYFKTEQIVFLSILLAVIVVANAIVLVIVYSSRKMRSPMNIFIANLAIADLMVGLFFVSTDLAEKVSEEWQGGDALCKTVKYLHALASYGSTYALVSLSIDRVISIARPLKAIGKGRRTRALVAISWALSCLFSLPMFLFGTRVSRGKVLCMMDLQQLWMWKMYIVLVTCAIFVIPAIIISICYVTIVVIIWKKSSFHVKSRGSLNEHSRIISGESCSENSTPMKVLNKKEVSRTEIGSSSRGLIPKAKIKTIKMTLVIVLAFILCWTPYFVYNLLNTFGHIQYSQESIALTVFFQSLAPLNSGANPFIYLLFNSQTYKRFCCRKQARNYIPSPSSTNMTHV